jgi:predicted TIM-barrel fold metal-dependent hydrolase
MEHLPIIDMHLHAFELMPGDTEPAEGLPAPDTPEQYMQDTINLLEKFNIRAVTSGAANIVQQWHQAAPGRIIPGIFFVHPDEINLDWIEEAFEKGELAVLGEIVTQLEGIPPNDPALEPIFAVAERLDIPVGYHVGFAAPATAYYDYPKYRASLSNPLLLEDVLIRHPDMRLYVCHAAWPMLDEMIHLLYSHPPSLC